MHRCIQAVLHRSRSENGQVLVMAALSITVLLGIVALATDVGIMLHEKRILQTAADSAAIAGAAQLSNAASNPGGGATHCNSNTNNCWYYAALTDALQNGIPNSSVTASNPPTLGPHTSSNGYVEVIVTQSQPTIFMRLFNTSSMAVSARAVATNTPWTNCVYTMGTGPTPDITIKGSDTLSLPTCGIVDAMAANPSISTNGQSQIITPSVQVPTGGGFTGANVVNSGGTAVTASQTSTPITDPLAGKVPTPSGYTCGAQPAGTTLGPASSTGVVCYNGLSFSGNGSYTFNPGVYVINGNFSTTGSLSITGSGVTIYMLSGSFTLGGTGAITLSAPTSTQNSTYENILFYQPSSNTSAIDLGGTGAGTFKGIIDAPGADFTLHGTSGGSLSVDLIVKTLTIKGTPIINAYVPLTGGPLTNVSLVE